MSRLNQLLLGDETYNKIKELNILLIGVGGIGCEVLKVITKYEFKSLHILDLDTIEVSNLNRQFLFRKEHRGHYKAHVAKERIEKDYPNINIKSYNDNIKDEKYGIKFFKQFQLIIMALDNVETRSFVNRLCMTLNIPVLDAGTTGYKGQAFLLRRGITRCYDCFPRDTNQKVYPACTIRTLPEKPVHCVIWAKYLFGVLFGPSDDESNMLEDLREQLLQNEGEKKPFEEWQELGIKIAKELFSISIKKQMETNKDEEVSEKFKHLKPLDFEKEFGKLEKRDLIKNIDLNFLKSIHPVIDYLEIFRDSYASLADQKSKDGSLSFEKDDPIHIKFVTSACNLRCHIFNIALQNEFKVKQISGNIIPAIASTNSIVAAIEISETIKYLASLQEQNKNIKHKELYVQNDKVNKVLAANIEKPNPKCVVCQPNLLPDVVYCDFAKTTFKQFVDEVILKEKQLEDFSISKEGNIIYEFNDYLEEDEQEQNQNRLKKSLEELFGIGDSKLNVTNEDSGNIFRLFIIVNVPEQKGLDVFKQVEGERNEVDINSIMKEQGVNIKDQQQIEEEQKEQEKKCKTMGDNQFQIVDSDEEIEMTTNSGDKNLKRQFENEQVSIDEQPQKKMKVDNQTTENNNNNEDDDGIIIL